MGASSTVIVVSYRPGPWLGECLTSVASQAQQVIVVDNGSDGAKVSQIASTFDVELVVSSVNTGFTGGVAQGLARATGEIVALLNDDAVASPGWLTSAAAVLADRRVAAVASKVLLAGWYRPVICDDDPWSAPGDSRVLGRRLSAVTVGGVDRLASLGGAGIHRLESGGGDRWRWTAGPVAFWVPVGDDLDAPLEVDGVRVAGGTPARLINSAGSYLRDDGYAGDHGLMAPDGAAFAEERECFAASGVALVTTAEVLERVGGLDPSFFAYYEDIDWCWRARLAGLSIRYCPAAIVEHRRGATSGGEHQEWVRRLAERNRSATLLRNAPPGFALRHLRQRLLSDDDPPLRRAVALRAPGSLARRMTSRRHRRVPYEAVWDRWAGVDTTWDLGR